MGRGRIESERKQTHRWRSSTSDSSFLPSPPLTSSLEPFGAVGSRAEGRVCSNSSGCESKDSEEGRPVGEQRKKQSDEREESVRV